MAPMLVVAAAFVLLDDLFRSVVVPAVERLARLRLFQRLEAWIAGLSPYATLALFLIPLAIIEPFKIVALYFLSEGRWIAAIVTFVAAKVIGIGLAERLFAISRAKLLSIGWFARAHGWVIASKDYIHAYLLTTRFWPALMRLTRRVRNGLARLKLAIRHRLGQANEGGFLGGRLATARRLAERALRRPGR